MVLNKLNLKKYIDYLEGTFDLKKYVFINARKQIRQKMEGISASQF